MGAKVFDDNSARSLTFQSKNIVNIIADGAGSAFYSFGPNPSTSWYSSTITAGAVSGWSAANTNGFYGLVGTNCGSWRVVSYGFKYCTTQAWTAAVGTIIITEVAGYNPALNTGQVVASPSLGTKSAVAPLRDAVMTFIGRSSGKSANDYTLLISANDQNDWTTAYVAVTGATAAATVGYVELVVNYEWLPLYNTAFGLMATQANPNVPIIQDTRSNTFGVMETIRSVKDVAETSAGVLNSIQATLSVAQGIGETAATIAANPYARAAGSLMMMA